MGAMRGAAAGCIGGVSGISAPILIPVAYIFLMLRRIFDEKAWLTALETVPVFLLFVIIEGATALAIVLGVTWASGHWSGS